MFSPHRIVRFTAIALTVGAVAAPVASARPARLAPNQSLAAVSVSQERQLQAARNHVAATHGAPNVAGPLRYSRQDKQLAPSSPSQAPATTAPPSAPVVSAGGGFDWGDAGIGAAGVLAISLVGIGGALAFSQRRTRRTRTSAIAAS